MRKPHRSRNALSQKVFTLTEKKTKKGLAQKNERPTLRKMPKSRLTPTQTPRYPTPPSNSPNKFLELPSLPTPAPANPMLSSLFSSPTLCPLCLPSVVKSSFALSARCEGSALISPVCLGAPCKGSALILPVCLGAPCVSALRSSFFSSYKLPTTDSQLPLTPLFPLDSANSLATPCISLTYTKPRGITSLEILQRPSQSLTTTTFTPSSTETPANKLFAENLPDKKEGLPKTTGSPPPSENLLQLVQSVRVVVHEDESILWIKQYPKQSTISR
jgi:hypothetical protein